MKHLVTVSALLVGLVVGGSGSAWYLDKSKAQGDRLLAVALSTQRRVGRVEDACSQRCNCQYPDLSALRATLSSAVAAPLAVASSAPPEPSADPALNAPPPDADKLIRAENLLANAERSRRWTASDRDQLRELLVGMPLPEHRRLSFGLNQLINDGKVQVDGDVPQF